MKVDKSSGLPEAIQKYAAQVSSTLQKKSRDVQATFNARIVNAKQLLSHIQATVKSSTVVKFLSSLPEEVKTHARVISKSVKQQQIDKQQKYFDTLLGKCEKNSITSKEVVKLADQLPSFIKTLPDDKANKMRARFRSAVHQNQNAQIYPQLAKALIESSPNNLEQFVAENTLHAIYDDNIKTNLDSIAAVNDVISKRNDLITEKQLDLKTNQGVIQSILDEITTEWEIQLDFVHRQLGESHEDVKKLRETFTTFKGVLASINDAKVLANTLGKLKLSIDSNSSDTGVNLKTRSAWVTLALLFKNDVIGEILHTTHITTGLQEEINLVKSIPHHKGALSDLCSDPCFPKDAFMEYVDFLKSCTFNSVESYQEFVNKAQVLTEAFIPNSINPQNQATLLFEALLQSENTHLFSEVAQHYLDTISTNPSRISHPEYLPVLKAVCQRCKLMQEIWETKNSIERMPQPVRGDSLNLASCRALLEKCQKGKELTFQEEEQFERIRQFLNTIPPGKTRDELENKWNRAAVTLLSNNLIKNKPMGDEALKRAYIALNTDPHLLDAVSKLPQFSKIEAGLWKEIESQFEKHGNRGTNSKFDLLIDITDILQTRKEETISRKEGDQKLQKRMGKDLTYEKDRINELIQGHPDKEKKALEQSIEEYINVLKGLDFRCAKGIVAFAESTRTLIRAFSTHKIDLAEDDVLPIVIYALITSKNLSFLTLPSQQPLPSRADTLTGALGSMLVKVESAVMSCDEDEMKTIE